MNTTIDLKTAKTIEAMNQKINHMDNAVTDFFNKMSDVLERQLGDDEVYAAVIAPEIELTITPLANVRSYLPCFDEADSCYSISDDVPMALCYDPRQVITLAGKRYLSGAVVFVRYDTNGSFVALTTSMSDKYDLTQHPNYKYTSDYDPKNALDIEKFLNRKEKIHPDDTFVMVDADSLPPA